MMLCFFLYISWKSHRWLFVVVHYLRPTGTLFVTICYILFMITVLVTRFHKLSFLGLPNVKSLNTQSELFS